MAAVHDVLRYLLERTPPSTQEEHDRIADLIEQDANPAPVADEASAAEPTSEKED